MPKTPIIIKHVSTEPAAQKLCSSKTKNWSPCLVAIDTRDFLASSCNGIDRGVAAGKNHGRISIHIFKSRLHSASYKEKWRHNYPSTFLSPNQARRFARNARRKNKCPDMRNCRTLGELVEVAFDHLNVMTQRDISAFWTLASKLANTRIKDKVQEKMGIQRVENVLVHTLEMIQRFGCRDLAQTALGIAKIVKSIERSGRRPSDSLGQILHDIFVGDNSTWKELIFKEIAVASMHILPEFDARHLSNLIYAFGIVEFSPMFEDGSIFFDLVALEAIPQLKTYNSHDISNLLYAYANMKAKSSQLFLESGDVIVAQHNLDSFKPQAISNIAWSYATMGESHPKLFRKVANHITAQHNLDSFKPQDFSNTLWAYATIGESNPKLFKKIADAAVTKKNEFSSQQISNTLWAYATNGHIDEHLYQSLALSAAELVDKFNSQGASNVAWAYAVSNVPAPTLFGQNFIDCCMEKQDEFTQEQLSQLHQWSLWQQELNSNISLSSTLQEKCFEAFISQVFHPSALQDDVISHLSSIGLQPVEEKLLQTGYRLDAFMEVNGNKIGIEVDGPFHFLGRKPTGNTILKRRQITNLEGIQVVSVPYWEWDKLKRDSNEKQKYLRSLLCLN